MPNFPLFSSSTAERSRTLLIGIHAVLVLSIYRVRHPVNDTVLLWLGLSGTSQDTNEIERNRERRMKKESGENGESIKDSKRG